MKYRFSYRRKWFWKSIDVIGHSVTNKLVRNQEGQKLISGKDNQGNTLYEQEYDTFQDKMTLYLPNGGIREIKNWSECECRLGADWFVETKKEMELAVSQKIPTVIDEK